MGWAKLPLKATKSHSVWTWEKVHEPLGRAGFLSPVGKTIADNVFAELGLQGVARKRGYYYNREQCHNEAVFLMDRNGIFQITFSAIFKSLVRLNLRHRGDFSVTLKKSGKIK